ncbi:PAS domain S-box protein [Bacillus sp. CGMCC 1.16607]|uniref:PAS domain-containing sensor histidine kinase n=1 Tax=Bacillus sp. CGMCC 1.16607 TaxID=3351842 RepID=UPI00362583C3
MKNNQELFQTVLNYTSDIIMIVDRNRHIVYITPNSYEYTGYGPEELQNRDTFFMVHPEDREYLEQRHKNLLNSKQSNSSEYRIVKKNGEVRYCECKTTPLPDTENYLQVVSTRDITERKLMELELERHKDRHELLQKSLRNFSHDLSSVMKHTDLEERLMKELEVTLPFSKPSILKMNPENENILKLQDLSVGKIETVSDKVIIKIGEKQKKLYVLSIEASAIHEKMDFIWLETLAYYTIMVFENLNMIEGLMNQLEDALQSRETPKWVLRMMFNLQEQQRMTLSSDLHDTVLQDQIDLYRRMESLLGRYEIKAEAKTKLKDIEQGLLDIIHDIRMTCNNLRPPLLRELGLERSLQNLFEHIQVSSTYKVIFTAEQISTLHLSEEQTIAIYRMVQELLHHADENSRANLIKFNLYSENDSLIMVYSDDGIGLVEHATDPSMHHLGLTSISQRAKSLGGKVEFRSEKGSGLIATIELPIKEKGDSFNG